MRLMLGVDNVASLLVEVADNYDPNNFEFDVVNGAWRGHYDHGVIRYPGRQDLDTIGARNVVILTDNQDRLRGNYNEVFVNFDNPNYVAPANRRYRVEDYTDDDIPF